MRRRTRLILLGLVGVVLGGATTVLVSWSLAMAYAETFKGGALQFTLSAPRAQTFHPTPGVAYTRTVVSERRALGARARWMGNSQTLPSDSHFMIGQATVDEWHANRPEAVLPFPDNVLSWGGLGRDRDTLGRYRQYAFGLPFPALWYERSGGLGMFGSAMRVHGGHEIGKTLNWKRTGIESYAALPYRPAWAGFALNTMVSGAMWFGLLLLFGRVRRRFRRAAHECAACRYNLKGLPAGAPCPECGKTQATA